MTRNRTPKDPAGETLGEYLRRRRLKRKVTLDAVADAIGTSRRQVIRWEGGENVPGPDNRRKLEDALGIPTGELDRFVADDRTAPLLARRMTHVEKELERQGVLLADLAQLLTDHLENVSAVRQQ